MTLKKIIRGTSILVVDDDKDVCDFLVRILTKNGFNTSFCYDSTKVIESLAKEPVQVIILDLMMPKLDGLSLLKEIRNRDSSVCVIILTAYPSLDRAFGAIRGMVFDFITKPFDTEVLLSSLARAEKHFGFLTKLYDQAVFQISSRLSELRKEKKMSIKQLAERSGLSQSLVSQIERTETAPSLATLCKLASALQTDLSYFFHGI